MAIDAAETVEAMDDPRKASEYLMKKAMRDGDGWMLRAVKTLMDRAPIGENE